MAWATSRRRTALPKGWANIRRQVLKRDTGRCVARMRDGDRCPERASEVDHIRDPDDHSLANLQSLCSWHHKIKTQAESAAARRRSPRDRRARPAEAHPGLMP